MLLIRNNRLLFKASTRNLIPVKRTVTRGGQSFVQTYWVRQRRKSADTNEQRRYEMPAPHSYGREIAERLFEINRAQGPKLAEAEAQVEQLLVRWEAARKEGAETEQIEAALAQAQATTTLLREQYQKSLWSALAPNNGVDPPQFHLFAQPRTVQTADGTTMELPEMSPEEMQPALEVLRQLEQITAVEGFPARYYYIQRCRTDVPEDPHALLRKETIVVSPDEPPQVLAHEFGHLIEQNISRARYAIESFWRRRTAGQPIEQYRLSQPTSPEHAVVEWIPDDFMYKYTGRIYRRDDRVSFALEVFSTGVEQLFIDPVNFALQDEDHFDLILQILHGRAWDYDPS